MMWFLSKWVEYSLVWDGYSCPCKIEVVRSIFDLYSHNHVPVCFILSRLHVSLQGEWAGSRGRDGLDTYHSSGGGLLTTGTPLRTSSAYLNRSPIKGMHDIPLTINTFTNGIDADSGIR